MSVLNACRRHEIGHAVVPATECHCVSAQRLSASSSRFTGPPACRTNSDPLCSTPVGVMDRSREVAARVHRLARMCSTPVGVIESVHPLPQSVRHVGEVLNACRRHGSGHGAYVGLRPNRVVLNACRRHEIGSRAP